MSSKAERRKAKHEEERSREPPTEGFQVPEGTSASEQYQKMYVAPPATAITVTQSTQRTKRHRDPSVKTEDPTEDEKERAEKRIAFLLGETERLTALNEGLAEKFEECQNDLRDEKAKAEKIELTGAKTNYKLHEEMEKLKTEMHKLQADHAKLQKDNEDLQHHHLNLLKDNQKLLENERILSERLQASSKHILEQQEVMDRAVKKEEITEDNQPPTPPVPAENPPVNPPPIPPVDPPPIPPVNPPIPPVNPPPVPPPDPRQNPPAGNPPVNPPLNQPNLQKVELDPDELEAKYKDEQAKRRHLIIGRNPAKLPINYRSINLDFHLSRLKIPNNRIGCSTITSKGNNIALHRYNEIALPPADEEY